MTATWKEDNNLNYDEIKCVNISQIISVINCQTLKFDHLRLVKSDFTTVLFQTRDLLTVDQQVCLLASEAGDAEELAQGDGHDHETYEYDEREADDRRYPFERVGPPYLVRRRHFDRLKLVGTVEVIDRLQSVAWFSFRER